MSQCTSREEYIQIDNMLSGSIYQLSLECSDNISFITVRRGTINGPIIQQGWGPIDFTAPANDTYFIHYNTDDNCGTSGSCCSSFIQCISCSTYPITDQECPGANQVCSNTSFSGNSDGLGFVQELDFITGGCLVGERQSSWYYINVGTGGTIEMTISPTNPSDDYDWAIWGPFTATTAADNCAPITEPHRCSFSSKNGDTGMDNGATDESEGPSGDKWVAPLNSSTGDVYILLIDNFSESFTPFNLSWGGDAILSCDEVVLPVELTHFTGKRIGNINQLKWETATETNNDYFILEHSVDGFSWSEITKMNGAGNSTEVNNYVFTHRDFDNVINYYRLTQVDFDGRRETYNVVSIDNSQKAKLIKRINTLGQEVGKNYKGMVIEYYDDNTIIKRHQY